MHFLNKLPLLFHYYFQVYHYFMLRHTFSGAKHMGGTLQQQCRTLHCPFSCSAFEGEQKSCQISISKLWFLCRSHCRSFPLSQAFYCFSFGWAWGSLIVKGCSETMPAEAIIGLLKSGWFCFQWLYNYWSWDTFHGYIEILAFVHFQ